MKRIPPGGTPKTLIGAIDNGLEGVTRARSSIAENVRVDVKDFLSQKFTVAINRDHSPEKEKYLMDLWRAITGEEPRE
jgi:hypothetical protein